jgi:hypothetical protein
MRARFERGPRLLLPLIDPQSQEGGADGVVLAGLGTYYTNIAVRDVWGDLRATDGAVVSERAGTILVAEPNDSGLAGPGWQLGLMPAYRVSHPDRFGVRRLEPNPESARP